MKDYELIERIEELKKEVFVIRLIIFVMTMIAAYLIVSQYVLYSVLVFVVMLIGSGIFGFPRQAEIKKIAQRLKDQN